MSKTIDRDELKKKLDNNEDFNLGFRLHGPWSNVLLFFLVVFLGAWIGNIWIVSLSPPLFGVYWVTPMVVGLIFALLMAAAYPPTPRSKQRKEINLDRKPNTVVVKIDAFFIILLFVFLIGIFIGYLR